MKGSIWDRLKCSDIIEGVLLERGSTVHGIPVKTLKNRIILTLTLFIGITYTHYI